MNPFEAMHAHALENEVCMAAVVARLAHKTHLWGGESFYKTHVMTTVERIKEDERADSNCMIVGFLMNAINETDLMIDELIIMGFNHVVIQILEVLLRRDKEEYFGYIMRIADYPICRFIKEKELEERLSKTPREKVEHQLYSRALHTLEGYNNAENFRQLGDGASPKPH